MALRYFEDFRPGEVIELGSRTVTEESIIAFAKEYDPHYFHIDPEAAKGSVFGGLVASGWQTAAIYMRLLVDGLFQEVASLASPGVDELRWPNPVRPGDTLTGRITIIETVPSKRRPDRGTIMHKCELFNQRGEPVLTLRGISILARRPKGALE